ncbi:eamA-like transporter family isoform X1 [Tasmannia lanceolata]|uniref:eamA-like transporter family isoform X1 n=2 Tax=Tasmannia lanceolata TaxID=3420 RepID=UPI0040633F6E
MQSQAWRWILGLIYIIVVASIWIAASFIVQSVVDAGVSPFLITYICNSLFVVYIPIVEIARYFEDSKWILWFRRSDNGSDMQRLGDSEKVVLLGENSSTTKGDGSNPSKFVDREQMGQHVKDVDVVYERESELHESGRILSGLGNSSVQPGPSKFGEDASKQLDAKGRWTRARVAKASLLVCPFWFLAQLTFNLSLKYTTVTSNTILSSASSLFTFLVSLAFLGEKFTWVKLISVLLCMAGTVIVSLGDSGTELNAIASKPILGDILALVSAGLYSIYITLIRKNLPDEEKGEGQASMAQFLGFLGLFNLLIFLPVALILNFTKLEPFHKLTWTQVGLIVGKGLLDNVLSDYLWAKAILLTTTTVATAGLTIQVPIAAVVDSLTGHAPHLMDYLGGVAVLIGFTGINIPSDAWSCSRRASQEQLDDDVSIVDENHNLPTTRDTTAIS